MLQFRFVALSAIVALAHSTIAWAPPTQPAARGEWTTKCVAGEDEFASNCHAEKSTRQWRVAMSTGDSQLFLTLTSNDCPQAIEQNSWWRDRMAGLSAPKRRAMLERALREMSGSIRRRCPRASSEGIHLGDFPDIAVHGDP
jgi:hypothetical protein